MAKRMAIRLVVDVDLETWEEIYGESPTRADVQRYVATLVRDSAAAEDGAIVEVAER